jgi:hypothetical protein
VVVETLRDEGLVVSALLDMQLAAIQTAVARLDPNVVPAADLRPSFEAHPAERLVLKMRSSPPLTSPADPIQVRPGHKSVKLSETEQAGNGLGYDSWRACVSAEFAESQATL